MFTDRIIDHAPRRTQASGGAPYDAGSNGRRATGWFASPLGPTTLLWGNLEQIRRRARDEIRNNPVACSAIDNFETQVIGSGIRPHWVLEDAALKQKIESEWNRWTEKCAADGRSDFYGMQALVARELFEAGEVLSRQLIRPARMKLRVPLQIQLIEGEQLPIFQNYAPASTGNVDMPQGNTMRTGIEFDPDNIRVAYHLYKEHPGETMFYPLEGLTYMRVPASEIEHIYKPLRAGQLRGLPFLTSTLTLLYELEKYSDAELLRKQVAAMFAGFIASPTGDPGVLPQDPNRAGTPSSAPPPQDPGVINGKIEAGTMQMLKPGESVTFPDTPDSGDYASFLKSTLRKFAKGVNSTYEMISGDLEGVSYSSIRAGLLDFRRGCEQLQHNVIVHQFCRPIVSRFLRTAQLSGALSLPGYAADPSIYEQIRWVPPGWDWVDPLKEMQAAQQAVRAGFTTRSRVVAASGLDSAEVDAENKRDAERADELDLTYDSDPRKVLIGRETNPTDPADEGDAAPKAAPAPGPKKQKSAAQREAV